MENEKIIPYLVQRAKIKNRPEKIGIDSILNFDYMGSAEFEFGALPESLERIRESISEYTYFDIRIADKKVVTVFCKVNVMQQIETYLNGLYEKEHYLQEYSGFPEVIDDRGRTYTENIDFWWDISNDIMFWIKSTEFEMKFKQKIQPK